METTGIQSTFRITPHNADARFLKRLSENMGWQLMRVLPRRIPLCTKRK